MQKASASLLASLAAVSMALTLAGCFQLEKPTEDPSQPAGRQVPRTESFNPFQASRGVFKPGKLHGEDIFYEERDGLKVFQGDILLSDAQMGSDALHKESAAGHPTYRWKNGVIPYEIATNDQEHLDWFYWAIATLSDYTTIRWIPRTTETDYVRVWGGNGCSANVGRLGGQQVLELATGCGYGGTMHEVLHAVGFWHEQSRADRDQYIQVFNQNIWDSWQHNFAKYSTNYGFDNGTFDFNSLMLYAPYQSSQVAMDPSSPVMTDLSGNTWTPNFDWPSTGDWRALVAMYPRWVSSGSSARDIGVGKSGAAFKVTTTVSGSDYTLQRWDGSKWVSFSGSGIKIDVNPSGVPWVVKKSGKVYYYGGSGTTWKEATGLSGAQDIGIGADGSVWALSSSTMSGSDYTLWKREGSTWSKKSGSGKRLTVDYKGRPWLVKNSGDVGLQNGSTWTRIANIKGKDIGAGSDGSVYVVSDQKSGSDYKIFRKAGKADQLQAGRNLFFEVTNALGTNIDVLPDGRAWITQANYNSRYIASIDPDFD